MNQRFLYAPNNKNLKAKQKQDQYFAPFNYNSFHLLWPLTSNNTMAININSASVKELTTLPGKGVKYAQIIVSKREELGLVSIDTFTITMSGKPILMNLQKRGYWF